MAALDVVRAPVRRSPTLPIALPRLLNPPPYSPVPLRLRASLPAAGMWVLAAGVLLSPAPAGLEGMWRGRSVG